jgi:hypothetical protein
MHHRNSVPNFYSLLERSTCTSLSSTLTANIKHRVEVEAARIHRAYTAVKAPSEQSIPRVTHARLLARPLSRNANRLLNREARSRIAQSPVERHTTLIRGPP